MKCRDKQCRPPRRDQPSYRLAEAGTVPRKVREDGWYVNVPWCACGAARKDISDPR
jgi:hypothetical protein